MVSNGFQVCWSLFDAAESADELEADGDRESAFHWRNTLLAPYSEVEMNFPDDLRDEEPLTVESDDMDDWRGTVGTLECQVFWDADYDILETGINYPVFPVKTSNPTPFTVYVGVQRHGAGQGVYAPSDVHD